MATELPKRSTAGSARRGGGVRLPGAENVPVVTPQRDPGLPPQQVPQGAFGQDEIAAAGEAGVALARAGERIRSREDAVGRAQAISAYTEESVSELRRIQVEEDLSDDAVAQKYAKGRKDSMAALLANHNGSEDSKARLLGRLEDMRVHYTDQAAAISIQAGRAKVKDVLGKSLNALSAAAYDDPARLPELFESADAMLDDMAPALTPEDEIAFSDGAREQIAVSALESLLDRGAFEEAQDVIDDTPGLMQVLTPKVRGKIEKRIAQVMKLEQDAQRQARQKLLELKTILGRDPTPAERARAAGVAPPKGERTIQDKVNDAEAVLGRPLKTSERAKLAGLDADGAQSKVGKLVEDRQRFVDSYGEDSPQVQAFDEMVASEQAGEKPKLTDVAGQRKEFTKLSSDFVSVRDSFTNITSAAAKSSAAGDLALMFNFMKMLDPGSVVRESEFATIASTGAFGERMKGLAEQFISGKRISEEVRRDFVERAEMVMIARLGTQVQLENSFRALAANAGMDPNDVVIDFLGPLRSRVPGAPPASTPTEQKPMKRLRMDLQGNIIGGAQ